MLDIKAVIGANYGDEGKGLVTRYLCQEALLKNKKPIVILHNGTSQRGHTIDLLNGKRHVLHHFGGGTFDDVPSFFYKTFLVHPLMFADEYMCLYSFPVEPKVFIDKECYVVTPIDLLIDQIYIEYSNEHSSCACGSWSATERIKNKNLAFTYNDFLTKDPFDLVCFIYKEWFWKRLHYLGIYEIPDKYKKESSISKMPIKQFLDALDFMSKKCLIADIDTLSKGYDELIFEGAQGLLLDVNNKDQEGYTTSSHTGLYNVMNAVKNIDYNSIQPYFVSRSYLTRHGDGPFAENSELYFDDETNIPNPYQGTLKFGTLDTYDLENRILDECSKYGVEDYSLVITHCNEVSSNVYSDAVTHLSKTKYAEDIIKLKKV